MASSTSLSMLEAGDEESRIHLAPEEKERGDDPNESRTLSAPTPPSSPNFDMPDGGTEAWLQVVGSFSSWLNTLYVKIPHIFSNFPTRKIFAGFLHPPFY
jgi:hypothetical protein